MKLFDLSPEERRAVYKFLAWHLGYVIYVFVFALLIYHFRLFKAYWFLKEVWILNFISPLHTLVFILISPYRRDWLRAVKNMYRALDGDPVFCALAFILLCVGFYLYNIVLWGLGSFVPSMLFT